MRYAIDRNGDRWSLKDDGKLYLDGCFPFPVSRSIEYTEENVGPLIWHDDEPSQDSKKVVAVEDRNGCKWKMQSDGMFDRIGFEPGFVFSREQLEKSHGPLVECDEPDQTNYAGGTQADWDAVSKPQHYFKNNLECITVIDAMVQGLSNVESVRMGNIIKYLWRFKQKNGKQDLEKARKYLDMLIEVQS